MHEIYSHATPFVEFKSVKSIAGYDRIKSEYSAYLTDESKISSTPFDFLFFPKNEAELAAVIREMSARKIPLTIAGARTGIVGYLIRFKWGNLAQPLAQIFTLLLESAGQSSMSSV